MNAILSDTIKEKLLASHYGCDGCPRRAFARLLAERLTCIVTPVSFVTSALFLVYNLQHGDMDENTLTEAYRELPDLVSDFLIDEIIVLADLTLPQDMAVAAKRYLAETLNGVEPQATTPNMDQPDMLSLAMTLAGYQHTLPS
ncbi:MAG: hypothetical protein WC750_03305 [Patescibacteria group bacterium]|jgi:hypothetical protein